MREYFKSWRRKIGVLTLLIALAVTLSWVRCQYVEDHLKLAWGQKSFSQSLIYRNGMMFGWNETHQVEPWSIKWRPRPLKSGERNVFSPADYPQFNWRWLSLGVGFAVPNEADANSQLQGVVGFKRSMYLFISHRILAIPLTLISVWLLLIRRA